MGYDALNSLADTCGLKVGLGCHIYISQFLSGYLEHSNLRCVVKHDYTLNSLADTWVLDAVGFPCVLIGLSIP